MYSKTNTVSLLGLEGKAIEVESDITSGMPAFNIVGLPIGKINREQELEGYMLIVLFLWHQFHFVYGNIGINKCNLKVD